MAKRVWLSVVLGLVGGLALITVGISRGVILVILGFLISSLVVLHASTQVSNALWRDVLRAIGITLLGTGVIGGILQLRSIREQLAAPLRDTVGEGIWDALIQPRELADEVYRNLVRAEFVYRDYHRDVQLEQKSDGLLVGPMIATWGVTNLSNNAATYVWRPWYADIDSAGGGVQDSLYQAFNEDLKEMGHWDILDSASWVNVDTSTGEPQLKVVIQPHQTVKFKASSAIGFSKDWEFFQYLRYASDSMKFTMTLPDSFGVDVRFLHADGKDTTLCSFRKDERVSPNYMKNTATITTGVLPFQGIWMSWAPRHKPARVGGRKQ